MNKVRKWKVVVDRPDYETKVFSVVADVISYGENYLQFSMEGKWVLSVPHSRVQHFIEE